MNKKKLLSLFHIVTKSHTNKLRHLTQRSARLFLRIIEFYSARWKIEAGFREIKQEIGNSQTQTRNPDAVTNHLHFCMAATTITWIYAEYLNQASIRRYAWNDWGQTTIYVKS